MSQGGGETHLLCEELKDVRALLLGLAEVRDERYDRLLNGSELLGGILDLESSVRIRFI